MEIMTHPRIRLGVNIDHVATIRNARGGRHPDPARAAALAMSAGADGITIHLREDRRHIRDEDLEAVRAAASLPINLEMAATEEMLDIAMRYRPHAACLVPEKREERTTEGGLDVARLHNSVAPFVQKLKLSGSRVSLFIEPDIIQVAVAEAMGAPVIELHTGKYVEHVFAGQTDEAEEELERLRIAAQEGARRGLEIHAGHGLTYETVKPVAAITEIRELNIGHFLMGEAIFVGLEEAVRKMRHLMDEARA
ncbi:MAG: pyridoxine 5'-phosphate synthase [Hirschia sp.]|nr:pyridoxine 5'-phosphate synthase [Hirschia sp.]MBB37122.1 pyridoxine 5'-phosphate synthase [Hirschia sp.]MBF19991.1 pyridoxine 5'-phosphate synthase [Hirschia sp.]